MDADLNRRLDYELRILKYEREKYIRLLECCNGFESIRLRKMHNKNGRSYFYAKRKGSDKYVYLGTKESPDVKSIREAHFLREAIRRIDSNISLINKFMTEYLPCDNHSVNAALSAAYRSDLYPVSNAYQREGSAWKKRRLAFQAEYPENYPEHKTEPTSDGVMVKTLSEVVLYERLKAAGLYLIYELPLVLNDYGPAVYPDCTVLSPIDLETEIIVEYVGRLDQPKYREDFARKVGRYIASGYIPGVNLFFVFGDKNGHIDSLQISKVISDICGF